MVILGISGLDRAMAFKEACWPGLDEREYRITQGHDAAAALVVDGRVVAAAAEERFDRVKHSSAFPTQAIAYCLREEQLRIEDVSGIVHAFDYAPYEKLYSMDPTTRDLYERVLSKESLLSSINEHVGYFPADRVHQVGHHLTHASGAYFTSGWDECLVVVLDAMSEAHGGTVYRARGGEFDVLCEMPANDSLGILYSLVTLHLGFEFNADEYKVMGLAPYGDAGRFRPFFEDAVELRRDGSVGVPILSLNYTRDERENFTVTRRFLQEHLAPSRSPDAEITDVHRDVAAALQECLSRSVLHICRHFRRATGLRQVAMAGGVALNCTAVGALMRSGAFENVHVQPGAGDDGAAVGAALHWSAVHGEVVSDRRGLPTLGPAYSLIEVDSRLAEYADVIQVRAFDSVSDTCRVASDRLLRGEVVAWFRGRMEFGPRALGNRSILGDPGRPEMRDRINASVKKRESFRPFAPAVTIEQVHRWFDVSTGTALPYMVATVDVRSEHRESLPAVTHADGSARVQTVSAAENADFHALLVALGERTGREMVVNTSFNVKGQPIVNSPSEAVETFLDTDMDALFIENRLVTRRP